MNILIHSHLFPNPVHTILGNFVYYYAEQLVKFGHKVTVVAPVPYVFPFIPKRHRWYLYKYVPYARKLGLIRIFHPKFLSIPKQKLLHLRGKFIYYSACRFYKKLMKEDKFDVIRKKLLDKKNFFEKYNKDMVVHKHAPSENRLQILASAIKALDTTKLQALMKKIQKYQMDKNKLLTEKGKLQQTIDINKRQIQKLKAYGKCPTCFQIVPDEHKQKIEKDLLLLVPIHEFLL